MTNPYSELIKEVRDGFIASAALHSVFANRQHRLQQEIHRGLCVIATLLIVITGLLALLEFRLLTVLQNPATLQQNDAPAEVHPATRQSQPVLPDRPLFERFVHHANAV